MKVVDVKSVLGKTEPYTMLLLPQDDTWVKFQSKTGIGGLARIDDDSELNLLAVHASLEGAGQFRNFIHQAKQEFDVIQLFLVENEKLQRALYRYDFKDGVDVNFGEIVKVMVWRRT